MSRNQAMQWNAPLLCAMIPALALVRRYVLVGRVGTIILSAIVAHTGWHWMGERYAVLRQFRFAMPVIDAAFLAGAMRWAMLAVVAVGLYWIVFGLRTRRLPTDAEDVSVNG